MLLKEKLYNEYLVRVGEIYDEFIDEHKNIVGGTFIQENDSDEDSAFNVDNTPVYSDNNEENKDVGDLLMNSKIVDTRFSFNNDGLEYATICPEKTIKKSEFVDIPCQIMNKSIIETGRLRKGVNKQTLENKIVINSEQTSLDKELKTPVLNQAIVKPVIKTCTVDETILEDMTRLQDQSLFMNESILTRTNGLYRRKARRRIGRRNEKRKIDINNFSEDNHKRIKIDNEPNYLLEYLAKHKAKQSESSDAERLKLKNELEETKREIQLLKQALLEIQKSKETEKKSLEGDRSDLQNTKINDDETRKIKKEESQNAEKEDNIIAQNEKVTYNKTEDLINEEKLIMERKIKKMGANRMHNVLIKPPTAIESSICLTTNIKPASNIKDIFKKAKNDYIEKVNKTIINNKNENCGDNSNKENIQIEIVQNQELDKSKPVFNKNVHKPKIGVEASQIRPHNLYKQSIDIQSIHGECKNYVPKCYIPFYSGEDEFESKEKKFIPAQFSKDPKLMYHVKKQNHSEIRQYFGDQKDIDVKRIFDRVENVSNDSPNKLRRNI